MTTRGRKIEALLWTIQTVLALLFAFAGVMKLAIMSTEMLAQSGMDGTFLKFIGLCETLGALGLILPGAFRIRQGLTGVAAASLVVIMIGATTITAASGMVLPALFPLVVGLLAAFVAYKRRQPTTQPAASRRVALQPAS